MLLELFSIKDIKVGFDAPIKFVNSAVAIRTLKNALANDPNSDLAKCPQDFELYKVGTLDTETGFIVSDLVHVVNLKDIVDVQA